MWTMAVKAAEHPHGTYVVGERVTLWGHEHTVLAVTDHPVKYYVTFDGECHRDDGKQMEVFRFIVPDNVDELEPVEIPASTWAAIARAIRPE